MPVETAHSPVGNALRLEQLHAANLLRGFDKLEDLGFARTDIDAAREKFYASHPEKRALARLERLEAEEAFIESDRALLSTSVYLLLLLSC
jgi:hypothetical protein